MKKYFYLILVVFSCTKDNPVQQVFNNAENSLNQGLIGLNYNGIYLNKVNDIQLYDTNGNFKKNIYTYNRQYFQTIDVKDSMILLSGNSYYTMFHCDSIPKMVFPQRNQAIDFHFYKNKLFYITPLEDNYDMNKNRTVIPFYNLNASEVIMQNGNLFQAKELTQISNYTFPASAKSYTVFNDSLLIFLNNSYELINLNQLNARSKTLASFNINSQYLHKMYSFENELYLALGNNIYSYHLINNNLILNKVIK